ncbi:LysR family transcriptional regulator, partial [Rhizobiaceae bacterium LC148]
PRPGGGRADSFSNLPLLLFEPGGNPRRIVDRWFAGNDVALNPTMSLGSVEAIKAMVGAGLGCAILPGMAVPPGERPDLVTRSLSPRLHRELAVVIRRDKRLHRGLKALRDGLLGLAASPPP